MTGSHREQQQNPKHQIPKQQHAQLHRSQPNICNMIHSLRPVLNVECAAQIGARALSMQQTKLNVHIQRRVYVYVWPKVCVCVNVNITPTQTCCLIVRARQKVICERRFVVGRITHCIHNTQLNNQQPTTTTTAPAAQHNNTQICVFLYSYPTPFHICTACSLTQKNTNINIHTTMRRICATLLCVSTENEALFAWLPT